LDEETLACSSYKGFVDPADQRFLKPNTYDNLMVDRIRDWCIEHGQVPPSTHGEFMVAIYRGLAKAYALSIRQLQEITGKTFTSLYIIGGGCKNEILDQWTATETGLTVYAGPVEATALGNTLIQMYATGDIATLQEGRDMIKREQKVRVFKP
jgi:rhamnulokinase